MLAEIIPKVHIFNNNIIINLEAIMVTKIDKFFSGNATCQFSVYSRCNAVTTGC
jgi:hypothetical protein